MEFLKTAPQRILIINIFGIGDVLFTTPLVRNLKKAYPDVTIDYICNRRTVDLIRNNPQIRKAYVYERDHFKKLAERSYCLHWRAVFRFLNQIRAQKYDIVFDFSLNGGISFMTLLSGIPHRIGFNFKKRSKFLTQKINRDENGYHDKHMVAYYLQLLEKLGVTTQINEMDMYLNEKQLAFADDFFTENALNHADYVIGIAPGGGASWGRDAHLKRWSSAKYAKLADNLIENQSAAIILFGDKSERDLCREIVKAMNNKPILACGKTDLHQFGALTRKCNLVVLNDGGPLHMAVASGARTVSIFGPVDDTVYGPYPRDGHAVIRKNFEGAVQYKGFRLKDGAETSQLDQTTVDDVYDVVVKQLNVK